MRRILLEDIQGVLEPDLSRVVTEDAKIAGVTASVTRYPGRLSRCGVVNGNNRRYGRSVWEAQLKEGSHLRQIMQRGAAFGLLEHPADGKISLSSPISHALTEVSLTEAGEVHGTITVLNTPEGLKLKALIEGGYKPTVSSRGFGSLLRASDGVDDVQDDFLCEGWDIVFTPSFADAHLTVESSGGGFGAAWDEPAPANKTEGTGSMDSASADKVFENDKCFVLTPTTPEANAKCAENTAWCTQFWAQYRKQGVQFFYIQSKADSEKIAIAVYPSRGSQPIRLEAYDSEDRQIDATATASRYGIPLTLFKSATPEVAPVTESKAPVQPKQPKTTTMDKSAIANRLATFESINPASLDAQRYANQMQQLNSLHEDVATFAAEDPKRSWEAQQLHTQISQLESRWGTAITKPSTELRRITENHSKLTSVLKSVVETGLTFKKKLVEARKNTTSTKKLVEDVAKRGRSWKALAEKLDAKNRKLEKRYGIACEMLDSLAAQYKTDNTALGRRVVELQFPEEVKKPSIAEALKKARKPKDIAAIRESITKGTEPSKDKLLGESKKPAAPAAQPVIVTENVQVITTSRGKPGSVTESIALAKRLSVSQQVAA